MVMMLKLRLIRQSRLIGQITTYPFKIADEINIATTHKQYYQLDMNQDADGDGESDIVVWYTLSNHGIYEQSQRM